MVLWFYGFMVSWFHCSIVPLLTADCRTETHGFQKLGAKVENPFVVHHKKIGLHLFRCKLKSWELVSFELASNMNSTLNT